MFRMLGPVLMIVGALGAAICGFAFSITMIHAEMERSGGGPQTLLSFESGPDEYIGQGQAYRYTPEDGAFSLWKDPNNRVIVHFSETPTIWWNLFLTAPNNGELRVGTYQYASRPATEGLPGLDFFGSGRGCNLTSGQFQVMEAQYSPTGEVLRFHAVFQQHCEGSAPAIVGRILYNI